MNERYLWDKSGPPDPDVLALEEALASLRHTPAPRPRRWLVPSLLAAAALVVGLFLTARWLERALLPGPGGYRVQVLAGEPTVDGELARELATTGATLECDARSSSRLLVGDIGSVVLEPDSRLRIGPRVGEGYRLDLERGSLVASIFAAPRIFTVGTPSGLAVDLGCVYRTTVLADDTTELSVTSGRVSFENEHGAALVPRGASTRARPGRAPSAPVFDDAPAAWKEAVRALEDRGTAGGTLAAVLASERAKDSLTLWHLLEHEEEGVRRPVARALALRLSEDEASGLEAVLAGDADARAGWRRTLERSW